MRRTRSPFQCLVGAKVDVVFERMGNVAIDNGTRERVLVFVACLPWEEPNVMSLLRYDHCKFDLATIVSGRLLAATSRNSPHGVSRPL